MVELTESMRQRDDLQFAEALNRVRTATCTQRDVEMFQSREIKETDPKYPHNALHVFKTNKSVNEHNENHLRVLNVDIIKIPCQDYTKDRNTAQLNLTAPVKSSDTGGLKEEISIAKGARVMLTLNIDVSDAGADPGFFPRGGTGHSATETPAWKVRRGVWGASPKKI